MIEHYILFISGSVFGFLSGITIVYCTFTETKNEKKQVEKNEL